MTGSQFQDPCARGVEKGKDLVELHEPLSQSVNFIFVDCKVGISACAAQVVGAEGCKLRSQLDPCTMFCSACAGGSEGLRRASKSAAWFAEVMLAVIVLPMGCGYVPYVVCDSQFEYVSLSVIYCL